MKNLFYFLLINTITLSAQDWFNTYGGDLGSAAYKIKQMPNEDFIFGGYSIESEGGSTVLYCAELINTET